MRDRAVAGATHLGVSVLIALTAMAVIFFVWYPSPLSGAQGVDRLVLIMIGVDVVVGPLITTLIFVRGKKGLRFDLAVIAAMQTLALLYGLKAIHGGRPAYVVFNVDRFDVVARAEVDPESLSRVTDQDLRPSAFGPRWVAAELPADSEQRSNLMFSAVSGGPDLPQLPEYFVPLEVMRDAMLKHLHPLHELRALNDLNDAAWRNFLGGLGRSETELGYLPLRANARDGAVVLDAQTAGIVAVRLVTPKFEPPPGNEQPSDDHGSGHHLDGRGSASG